MNMIRIVLADDHRILRQGVKQVLQENEDFQVVGEAATLSELEDCLSSTPCHVLILDLAFPGSVGVEGLRRIRSKFPSLNILILSMYGEDQYAVRCLKAGALGYMTKENASEELLLATSIVARGKRYITSVVADLLASEVTKEDNPSIDQVLSGRELEVLLLIGEGLTPKGIGIRLGLNIKTVSTYRSRILEKTGLNSTADLVKLVMERGLTSNR